MKFIHLALLTVIVSLAIAGNALAADHTSGSVSATLSLVQTVEFVGANGNVAVTLDAGQTQDAITNGFYGPFTTPNLKWMSNSPLSWTLKAQASGNFTNGTGKLGLQVHDDGPGAAAPYKTLVSPSSGAPQAAVIINSGAVGGVDNWTTGGSPISLIINGIDVADPPGLYSTTVTYTLTGT